ncbi:MAG: hypothetical protein GX238_01390 [Epulopiscium sp.]|nr:hypothetical protein [Candidatus Epulonipiscium sp.]
MGNLAFRNAWFSGGIEWNCGVVGHHPYTCSPLFIATLTGDEGTPVLRMYEFERIRCATYQIDFFGKSIRINENIFANSIKMVTVLSRLPQVG